ncbi:MAG: hypothetical protein V4773_30010 [Verrucomicrobiota bacterium]
MSPFKVTMSEVVAKFSTSRERVAILNGVLDLRADLRRMGINGGFQWFDGSFLENVEKTRPGPPRDIDVVTFFHATVPAVPPDPAILARLQNHAATKSHYHVDHYLVPLRDSSERLIEQSRYWFGLFSHQRGTAVWKGMLQIDVMTETDDTAARQALAMLTFP